MDDRDLPFEGAGAISEWRLELSGKWKDTSGNAVEYPQLDFGTISDGVLHIRYTAREGGELLKRQAVTELQDVINQIALAEKRTGLFRLFSGGDYSSPAIGIGSYIQKTQMTSTR